MDTTTTTPAKAPATGAPRPPRPAGARPPMGARRPGGPSTGGPRGASSGARTGGPSSGPRTGGPGGARGGDRRGGSRSNFERPKPEFDQKMLSIRRVTRVVSGGRRMSFAVSIAIGDKKGSIGVGTGKAGDTSLAINKAVRSARKNMIKLKLSKTGSIPHEVEAKYGSARVMIMPNRGKGLVSGSATRDILNLAGVSNVTSKINSGSKNKLNIARVTMLALAKIATKRSVETKPTAFTGERPQH
jgi:small subunit ribosomal protein S5